MTSLEKALRDFAQFVGKLRGDEESEAQTFRLNFLFARAFRPHFGNNWVQITVANCRSLRDLSRTLETPGANRVHDAQADLDSAVRAAYGLNATEDTLAFLLRLNLELAEKEADGQPITPPGLPISQVAGFISTDCVQPT